MYFLVGLVHQKLTDILQTQRFLMILSMKQPQLVLLQDKCDLVNVEGGPTKIIYLQEFGSYLLHQQHLSRLRWNGI